MPLAGCLAAAKWGWIDRPLQGLAAGLVVGGVVTAVFAWVADKIADDGTLLRRKEIDWKKTVTSIVISSVLTFLASEFATRSRLPLVWRGVLVGSVAGSVWMFDRIFLTSIVGGVNSSEH